MIRTQVYFPDNVYHTIQELAKRESVSMAEKIRECVIKDLGLKRKKAKPFLTSLLEMGFKGKQNTPKDLSINHNKYLYD